LVEHGLLGDVGIIVGDDPAALLMQIAELQRAMEKCGGPLVLTQLSREGISQRVVANWPDTIAPAARGSA
jgi:hypothetical protein